MLQASGRMPSSPRNLNFCSRPSTEWMRSTHIMKGNFYPKVNRLQMLPHLQNTFTAMPQSMFDEIARYHSLAQLTHKINCYRHILSDLSEIPEWAILQRQEADWWLPRAEGREVWLVTAGDKELFQGVINVWKSDHGDDCRVTKIIDLYIKGRDFMIHELYLKDTFLKRDDDLW